MVETATGLVMFDSDCFHWRKGETGVGVVAVALLRFNSVRSVRERISLPWLVSKPGRTPHLSQLTTAAVAYRGHWISMNWRLNGITIQ
jgi:hypothetical protein